jgi:hypothetical protein
MTVSSTQPASTAESTVIPSTQYPSGGIITANSTEAVTTHDNGEFIPTQELEARQVVQATQPKKRGRPFGSKDRQPRKKRVQKAQEQEGEQVGE